MPSHIIIHNCVCISFAILPPAKECTLFTLTGKHKYDDLDYYTTPNGFVQIVYTQY